MAWWVLSYSDSDSNLSQTSTSHSSCCHIVVGPHTLRWEQAEAPPRLVPKVLTVGGQFREFKPSSIILTGEHGAIVLQGALWRGPFFAAIGGCLHNPPGTLEEYLDNRYLALQKNYFFLILKSFRQKVGSGGRWSRLRKSQDERQERSIRWNRKTPSWCPRWLILALSLILLVLRP